MSTKALFPCGGGSNLILGIGKENQIFILRTPATIKFFHQILKNCHFGVKKKIIVDLMKDLKYEHQSILPLLGRVKLNFRDR